MPFQLTIAEGQDSGKAFSFEQPSITIGRTDECDVVLYDPGVSRQHARIFSEGAAYFVEDMGSANGTRVNGQAVTKQKLAEGDSVTLGGAVFKFSEKVPPPSQAEADAPNNTRIVPADEISKKKRALVPDNASPEQLGALGRRQTQAMTSTEADQALKGKAGSGLRKSSDRPGGRISAAERARIRRENPGMLGTVQLFWLDSSDPIRAGIAAASGIVLIGFIATIYYFALSTPTLKHPKPPEPTVVGLKTIPQSFGLGEGVDYKHRDSKVFEFEFNAATRALLILHYQSVDISDGEVDVSVNGTSVGKLAPDTVYSLERPNDMILRSSLVKRGERNVIAFDNVLNPPGYETWRVWNLWLETSLLPDEPPEQLLREARDAYQRGQVEFERREVGAGDRYAAWHDFREAWLKLEAYPDPKPDLYRASQERMHESQGELDRICKKLLLEVEGYYHQRAFQDARHTLDYVREYFPSDTDQACPNLAQRKRYQYGL